MLAIGVDGDHPAIPVALGKANAGLTRAPGALADGKPQNGGSGRLRGTRRTVRAGVVNHQNRTAQGRTDAGNDRADGGDFVTCRDHSQTLGGGGQAQLLVRRNKWGRDSRQPLALVSIDRTDLPSHPFVLSPSNQAFVVSQSNHERNQWGTAS